MDFLFKLFDVSLFSLPMSPAFDLVVIHGLKRKVSTFVLVYSIPDVASLLVLSLALDLDA